MCKTVSYSETVNFDKLPQKLSNQFKLFSGPNKHNSAVTCLQFNSKFVITSSDDGTVKLWDVKTGKNLINLKLSFNMGLGPTFGAELWGQPLRAKTFCANLCAEFFGISCMIFVYSFFF